MMGNLLDTRRSLEDLEIDLLLEGVYQQYGFDFRGYERAALKIKLNALLNTHRIATFSGLQDRIMHDPEMGDIFLRELSARTAGLFDDPEDMKSLREITIPWLRSHPSPKIWMAECIAPEEVCTLAIILAEEGIYDRTHIFATGANESLLRKASTGGVAFQKLSECEENYRKSGGKETLSSHFQISGEHAMLMPQLRANITWAQFNLQSDASFNEFHLIICRRVLSDFGTALRCRILHLFHDSLSMFGQLSVDSASKIEPWPFSYCFRPLTPANSLYKRIT